MYFTFKFRTMRLRELQLLTTQTDIPEFEWSDLFWRTIRVEHSITLASKLHTACGESLTSLIISKLICHSEAAAVSTNLSIIDTAQVRAGKHTLWSCCNQPNKLFQPHIKRDSNTAFQVKFKTKAYTNLLIFLPILKPSTMSLQWQRPGLSRPRPNYIVFMRSSYQLFAGIVA